jgi:ribosomal protein S18 acetylase RimI-like enzyme
VADAAALFPDAQLWDKVTLLSWESARFSLAKGQQRAIGMVLFIVSMLLAVSTVSTIATIACAGISCVVMTTYLEKRLVKVSTKERIIEDMTAPQNSRLNSLYFGKAQGRDFLGIAELDRRAWVDNRNPEFIPDGEHVWRVWVDGAYVYLARDHAEIVGAILTFPTRGGTLCVHKVIVDKQYRGRGIGTKLFELLLTDVDTHIKASCYLTVDPANTAALKLYEKWGFTERQYVAGYYRENEDRYVLTRPAVNRETAG